MGAWLARVVPACQPHLLLVPCACDCDFWSRMAAHVSEYGLSALHRAVGGERLLVCTFVDSAALVYRETIYESARVSAFAVVVSLFCNTVGSVWLVFV